MAMFSFRNAECDSGKAEWSLSTTAEVVNRIGFRNAEDDKVTT
ncbi:MAG: hypothetical protein ACK6DZ_04005 [Acidobacteriota bacterium]|jgi:hypothetical protein